MSDGILGRYWKAYGGFKALFTSAYLYLAIVASLLMAPAWINNSWHELVLSVMPSVLGFSLGGYALLLAIGDENFRALISGEDEDGETSPYMEVNAAFVHFILMQLLSLLCALFASAYNFEIDPNGRIASLIKLYNFPIDHLVLTWNFIGYTLFIYALLTAFAATLAILRVSSWYDKQQTQRINAERELAQQKHLAKRNPSE